MVILISTTSASMATATPLISERGPPEWRRKCWRRSAPDCGRSSGRSRRVIRAVSQLWFAPGLSGRAPTRASGCAGGLGGSGKAHRHRRDRAGLLPADLDAGAQAEYFAGQLRLARRHDLPVIIPPVTRWIRSSSTCGVLPACAGWCTASPVAGPGPAVARSGFPARLRWAADLFARHPAAWPDPYLPLDGFMLETDSPDQPASTHPGQRNEPAFLPEVLACVAELRGADPTGSPPPPAPTPAGCSESPMPYPQARTEI